MTNDSNDPIELTVDKFIFRFRRNLRYSETGREGTLKRLQRALESAVKYSLVANSIKSKLSVEPEIETIT